jgi:hypothetical protein
VSVTVKNGRVPDSSGLEQRRFAEDLRGSQL